MATIQNTTNAKIKQFSMTLADWHTARVCKSPDWAKTELWEVDIFDRDCGYGMRLLFSHLGDTYDRRFYSYRRTQYGTTEDVSAMIQTDSWVANEVMRVLNGFCNSLGYILPKDTRIPYNDAVTTSVNLHVDPVLDTLRQMAFELRELELTERTTLAEFGAMANNISARLANKTGQYMLQFEYVSDDACCMEFADATTLVFKVDPDIPSLVQVVTDNHLLRDPTGLVRITDLPAYVTGTAEKLAYRTYEMPPTESRTMSAAQPNVGASSTLSNIRWVLETQKDATPETVIAALAAHISKLNDGCVTAFTTSGPIVSDPKFNQQGCAFRFHWRHITYVFTLISPIHWQFSCDDLDLDRAVRRSIEQGCDLVTLFDRAIAARPTLMVCDIAACMSDNADMWHDVVIAQLRKLPVNIQHGVLDNDVYVHCAFNPPSTPAYRTEGYEFTVEYRGRKLQFKACSPTRWRFTSSDTYLNSRADCKNGDYVTPEIATLLNAIVENLN